MTGMVTENNLFLKKTAKNLGKFLSMSFMNLSANPSFLKWDQKVNFKVRSYFRYRRGTFSSTWFCVLSYKLHNTKKETDFCAQKHFRKKPKTDYPDMKSVNFLSIGNTSCCMF